MASSTSTASPPTASVRGAVGAARRSTVVLALTGALIGIVSSLIGPYIWFRPNRIVDGTAETAIGAFGFTGWLIVALWVATGALALVSPGRVLGIVRALVVTAAITLAFAAAGGAAAEFAASSGAVARTSLGGSFYVGLFGVFLSLYAAAADTPHPAGRALVWLAPLVAIAALAASGVLAELGIVREWLMTRDTFTREFRRHLSYALSATIGATLLGVPLGVLSARNRRAETVVMGTLNLGQVFPALAFVGIMMPVLGALGANVRPLGAIGVSGIGWAPVTIVLLVYALFPVTRNTLVAIRQLDPAVLDSARGMGMGRGRLLAEIELPLAFPVVLAGIRIALVQSTAGAIVAAFVGGGGLGAIMFFGLEQTSMDLVLVGVVPIVALALAFDAGLRVVESLAGGPEMAGAT